MTAQRTTLDLSLYLVTSSVLTGRERLVPTVLAAVDGGVRVVQLREPDAADAEVLALARDLAQALAPTGVPLLIDDRVHLVERSGAGGAHVGQSDLPAAQARELLGPDRWLGVSTHTVDQAKAAEREGYADYLGIGAAWPTSTKDTGRDALGPQGVREVAISTRLPSVAIGGIGVAEAAQLRSTGVEGVAVVSAICGASDPRSAAARLRTAWERGVVG